MVFFGETIICRGARDDEGAEPRAERNERTNGGAEMRRCKFFRTPPFFSYACRLFRATKQENYR